MKFKLVKKLTESHQERTVYNALASWENYEYKYGKSDALFELKYNFKLTNEELAWILKQLLKKQYIDEDDLKWQIKYLKLEDYFPGKLGESLESASKELLDKFEGYYPIEDTPENGSAYILPNGKFLNLYPATHEIFKDDLKEYDVYFPYLYQSIQINDGNNPEDPLPNAYILIDNKPTIDQYDSLLIWLDRLKNKSINVWARNQNNIYDLNEYIPEDIIKRIKKYFATGRLDEGINPLPRSEEPYPLNQLWVDRDKIKYNKYVLDVPYNTQIINTKKLISNQYYVDDDKVDDLIFKAGIGVNPPIVVEYEDAYIVLDGNHRSAAAIKANQDKIACKVFKFEDVEEAYYNKLNELDSSQLTEGYLDDDEEFYDYGTGEAIDKDIFDINKGESPYAKEMIKLSKTGGTNEKGLGAEIIQMTPKEYFEDMARGFNSTFDKQIKQIEYDKRVLDHLKQVITKYKRKFPITYINVDSKYGNFEQEGRHRMYVAGELFGWDTKFPVMKIFEKDKEKADKIRLEEKKEKYLKILRTALRKAEPYYYRDLDELKQQVDYELESEFSYQDDPNYKFELKDKGNDIDFILNDLVTITRDKEDFSINPNKPEPEDIDDYDLSDEEMAELENELGLKFNESASGLDRVIIKAVLINTDEDPNKPIPEFEGFDKDGIYVLDRDVYIAFEKRYKSHPEGWGLIHQDVIDKYYKKYFSEDALWQCRDYYLEIDNNFSDNLYYDVNGMRGDPIFKYYVRDIKNAVDDYFNY